MNIEELRDYCLMKEGATEKTPFGKFARRYDSILVFYVLDHMFCFADMDDFSCVTVKSTPEAIDELRLSRCAAGDPLNLSARHWVRLDLDGDISDNEIYALVDRAYEIVREKYTPKTSTRRRTSRRKNG